MAVAGSAPSPTVPPRFVALASGCDAFATMSVLIVDDDQALLRSLSHWLTGSRISVQLADTAREGRIAASTGIFDVIVLDVMLDGDVDGFQTCEQAGSSRTSTE